MVFALNESPKRWNDGAIGKAISPGETCRVALDRLQGLPEPLLESVAPVSRPSQIPQYRVIGTERFMRVARQRVCHGKGHSEEQAKASGLMELIERFSAGDYFARMPPTLSSLAAQGERGYGVAALASHLVDGRAFAALADGHLGRLLLDARLRFFPALSLDGSTALVPFPLLRFLVMGTNGLAAGNTIEEALVHAISEVVERHCRTLVEARRIETPILDRDTITSPIARSLLERFAALGNDVILRDLSLGMGVPAIGVVRRVSANEVVFTAGVAPDPEEALVRALTESSQGEGSRAENRRTVADAEHLLARGASVAWSELPSLAAPDHRAEVQALAAALARRDMGLHLIDATSPELGIPAVVTVVTRAKMRDARIAARSLVHAVVGEQIAIGEYGYAEAILDAADAVVEDRAVNRFLRGLVRRRQARYAEAAELFASFLADPASVRVAGDARLLASCRFNLALCALAQGRDGEAAAWLAGLARGARFAALDIRTLLAEARANCAAVAELRPESALVDRAQELLDECLCKASPPDGTRPAFRGPAQRPAIGALRSGDTGLGWLFDAVGPALPAHVSAATSDAVRTLCDRLPARLASSAILECRLGGGGPVDWQLCVRANGGREALNAFLTDGVVPPGWHGLGALARVWSDASSSLFGRSHVWLEFDEAQLFAPVPAPVVFFSLRPLSFVAPDPSALPAVADLNPLLQGCGLLRGHPLAADVRDRLSSCVNALPGGSGVLFAAVMTARETDSVRLIVSMPVDHFSDYLTEIGFPGPTVTFSRVADQLARFANVRLALDIGTNVGPTLGLECFLRSSRRDPAPARELFSAWLLGERLASAETLADIRRWPAEQQVMPPDRSPCRLVRDVSHVKVVVRDDALIEAKVYLMARLVEAGEAELKSR